MDSNESLVLNHEELVDSFLQVLKSITNVFDCVTDFLKPLAHSVGVQVIDLELTDEGIHEPLISCGAEVLMTYIVNDDALRPGAKTPLLLDSNIQGAGLIVFSNHHGDRDVADVFERNELSLILALDPFI